MRANKIDGGKLSSEARFREVKELSWIPVRAGDAYCSPACGHGCARADFERATRMGYALARRLNAKLPRLVDPRHSTWNGIERGGWIPRVSENMGWHYSAVSSCGRWCVGASNRHSFGSSGFGRIWRYWAMLGDPGSHGGRWTDDGKRYKSPERAVMSALRSFRSDVSRFADLLVY